MKKSTRDYLHDLLDYVRDVRAFTAGMDAAAFRADRKTQRAVEAMLASVSPDEDGG